MTLARTLMVQGTASGVGKSLLVTALCRLFRDEGLRVAPFKAQNMSNNAFVTADGGEVGRAQALQAQAAGVSLTVDMNPVLLKPEGEARSQVVVLGRPAGRVTAGSYRGRKPELATVIADALSRLRAAHDVVVIEGAGSPAEVNLKRDEIVNMHVARLADAPVLLAADIDRGGVFASLVGTLALLDEDERRRIAGFIVNKFRGDRALLEPGLAFLEQHTSRPVLGVVPFVHGLGLPDEDGLALDQRARRERPPARELDIVVVRFPRIANHDDFDPLEHEPGVCLRHTDDPADLWTADLVILPGSKAVMADLAWMLERGFSRPLVERARRGDPVLGICGGYQMLGETIEDPDGVESAADRFARGLGLLRVRTRFGPDKVTARVTARVHTGFFGDCAEDMPLIEGYEIHMGAVHSTKPGLDESNAPFDIATRNGAPSPAPEGTQEGGVLGTLIHGLFANPAVREGLLRNLRARRNLPLPATRASLTTDAAIDEWAATVKRHVSWRRIRDLCAPNAPR
jgi:adenosylcobyric acid synthase